MNVKFKSAKLLPKNGAITRKYGFYLNALPWKAANGSFYSGWQKKDGAFYIWTFHFFVLKLIISTFLCKIPISFHISWMHMVTIAIDFFFIWFSASSFLLMTPFPTLHYLWTEKNRATKHVYVRHRLRFQFSEEIRIAILGIGISISKTERVHPFVSFFLLRI